MHAVPDSLTILAGRVFDPFSLDFLENQAITVSSRTGLIEDIRPLSTDDDGSKPGVVDLRGLTVLPGFVDTHVHCKSSFPYLRLLDTHISLSVFLHSYSEATWDDQLTKETLVERTVRATNHARSTLMAGFTTVRYECSVLCIFVAE